MKKVLFISVAFLLLGAGCASMPPQELLRSGVLVNYRTDVSVVFYIDGYSTSSGSVNVTVPKAVKNAAGTTQPTFMPITLYGKRHYWVELTKSGCEFPYSRGFVWVDQFTQDALVEGTRYDFGIYAR